MKLNLAYLDPGSIGAAVQILAAAFAAFLLSGRRTWRWIVDQAQVAIGGAVASEVGLSTLLAKPTKLRRIIFLIEGPRDWPFLQSIWYNLAERQHIEVVLVSLSKRSGDIPEAITLLSTFSRSLFFRRAIANSVVTTVTDLGTERFPKPRRCGRSVYVFHSLVSTHGVYRQKAFDGFDVVMCAGPHQKREILVREREANLPPKLLLESGYPFLDIEPLPLPDKPLIANRSESVLLAPSWGPDGLIEGAAASVVIGALLAANFHVTLRPHPETLKRSASKLRELLDTFSQDALVIDNGALDGLRATEANYLITDWSGIAIEAAVTSRVPIVFVDAPYKLRNPDWQTVGEPLIEMTIRGWLGPILPVEKLFDVANVLSEATSEEYLSRRAAFRETVTYNLGSSGHQIAASILQVVGADKD